MISIRAPYLFLLTAVLLSSCGIDEVTAGSCQYLDVYGQPVSSFEKAYLNPEKDADFVFEKSIKDKKFSLITILYPKNHIHSGGVNVPLWHRTANEWEVDPDLEKFFQIIEDKRVIARLKIIFLTENLKLLGQKSYENILLGKSSADKDCYNHELIQSYAQRFNIHTLNKLVAYYNLNVKI
jgi:hypothetical protein